MPCAAPSQALRAEVAALHGELTRYGLVIWTAGNVSARVPGADLMVIKPSGVSYDDLDRRRDRRLRPLRRARRGRPRPEQRHRRGRLRLPAHARGRRRRAHALHLRLRLGRPPRADPLRADDDRRRVRRRGPRRPVRPHRRRLDRPRHRRDAAGLAQPRRAHGRARPLHRRARRPRRRQGRRDARGRRPHRARRAASSASRQPLDPADVDAPLRPVPERLRTARRLTQ